MHPWACYELALSVELSAPKVDKTLVKKNTEGRIFANIYPGFQSNVYHPVLAFWGENSREIVKKDTLQPFLACFW